MTERQRAFAEHYAACGNAREAAERAGYSPRTARSQGHRLLTDVAFSDVQAYVKQLQTELQGDRIADAAEVKTMLTSILRDQGERASARIQAGGLLLKTGGEMIPREPTQFDEGDEAPVPIIQPDIAAAFPFDARSAITGILNNDGTITRLPYSGPEIVVFITEDELKQIFDWRQNDNAQH